MQLCYLFPTNWGLARALTDAERAKYQELEKLSSQKVIRKA